MRRLLLFGLGALAFALEGCGSKTPFPIAPVTGRVVRADGRPLDALQVSVVFVPQPSRSRGGRANVNLEDGTFQLTTFKFGDGAAVGMNKVGIEVMAKNHALTRPKFTLVSDPKPVTIVQVKPGKNYFEFKLPK